MANENAPLSRKEEEEKKAAEAQQQSGYSTGKSETAFNRWMNKRSPLGSRSRLKKKSQVSQPGDASEIQADAVAKAVTEGNANAAQVELQNDHAFGLTSVNDSEITAKATDVSIETPPGFEEQVEKMKGGGLPLPDDKKAGLEEMMGTDLDHVRLHTGSDAAELSAQINALAFATGDDIFYPGDLNDEELLAHEVAHVVQRGENHIATKSIFRTGKEPLKSPDAQVTFTIDISHYLPERSPANAAKSADFVFAQLYNITPEEAGKFISYSLLNNDGSLYAGYTDTDVARGTATITLKTSLYLNGLEKTAHLSKGITKVLFAAEKIKSAKEELLNEQNAWHSMTDRLREAYREMLQFTIEDTKLLKQQYLLKNKCSIEQDVKYIEKELNEDYTNRYYDTPHRNGKFLIAGITFILTETAVQPLLFDDPDQHTDDKPKQRIIVTPATQVITKAQEVMFAIFDEQAGANTSYDWYVLYDPIYESPSKGQIWHEKGTNTFSHKWVDAGRHRVVCVFTDKLGQQQTVAAFQYVYPHIEEFADNTAPFDIAGQENVNLFSDLMSNESRVTELRLKYYPGPLSEKFVERFKEVDQAVSTLSTKIRELVLSNQTILYQTSEISKFDTLLSAAHQNNENNKVPQVPSILNTSSAATSTTVPTSEFSVSETKSKISCFYDAIRSECFLGDLTTGLWDILERSDYRLYSTSLFFTGSTLTSDNVISWTARLKEYRIMLNVLDEYATGYTEDENERQEFEELKEKNVITENLAELYELHPDGITVPAIFYPNEQALQFDPDNASSLAPQPNNYKAMGYRILLYLYRKDETTWALREAKSGAENEVAALKAEKALTDNARINELFQKLNSSYRFPKGVIKYNFPEKIDNGQITYKLREVITTADTPLSTWLMGAGAVIALIALTAVTMGAASVVVSTLMVGSSGLMVAGTIASWVEKEEQGMMTKSDYAIDLLLIAADLMLLGSTGLKLTSILAKDGSELARFSGRYFLKLQQYSLAAGKLTMLVATKEMFDQLNQTLKIKDDKERRFAIIRLLGHAFLIFGAHVVSNKFNWKYGKSWENRHKNTNTILEIGTYKYAQGDISETMTTSGPGSKKVSIKETIKQMKKDGYDFAAEPPQVVDLGAEGKTSLDHRRVFAAKMAGLPEHPAQLIDGKTKVPVDQKARYQLEIKGKSRKKPITQTQDTIDEIEQKIGRKIDLSNPQSLLPVNYREAVIFRCANQRIKGYPDFPLLGSESTPVIK